MRYLIFVIDDRSNSGTPEEAAAIDEFNEALRRDGHWVMAAGIGAPDTASLIDNRSGTVLSTQASLFGGTEFYSGFWIVEAPDAALAEQLAAAGSAACNRRVELRPFLR